MALSPLTPPSGPTAGPPVVITTASRTTSNTQSSRTVTTGTISSSSSGYASTTSTSSSSSSKNGLSTGARAGLAIGIVFFLILFSLLFANLKRRYQRAREKVDDEPALVTSEVSQRLPPQSVASRGRDFPPPPPPRLDTTYPNSPDISSAAPLLNHNSHRNSYPVSAQNRYNTLSQATDPQRTATQDVPTLPNPHEPFSSPARPASYYSPTYSIPYDASASVAMMAPFSAPAGGSSSNSQSELQLSALHADMARHQKELELEHKKRSLDEAREQQDPPPKYFLECASRTISQ